MSKELKKETVNLVKQKEKTIKGFEILKIPKRFRNRDVLSISIYIIKQNKKYYAFGIGAGVIRALGLPKTLKVMINREENKLAIMPNGQIKTKLTPFPSARVTNVGFTEEIIKITGNRKKKYIGEYNKEYNAVIFDLD